MIEDIETIKKRAAVFLLEGAEKHELIDRAIEYFNIEINGDEVSSSDWDSLVQALDLDLALALVLDLALGLALALTRAQALALDLTRDLDLALGLDLARDLPRDLDLDLAKFLLPFVGHIAPKIDLPGEILKNISHLDMKEWHSDCGTTHCLAGWAEHLSGDAGEYLHKHFGHEVAGNIIFLKNLGIAPNFHSDNETAIDWLEDRMH